MFKTAIWFFLTGILLLHVSILQVRAETPQKVDSLERLLPVREGIEKALLYIDLVASIRNIDPAQGINYAKEALKLPEFQNNALLRAQLINEQGVCYRKLNIPEKALELHLQSLKLFEDKHDSTGIAFTLANIGNVYHLLGNVEKALDNHFRSLYLKEFLKDEPQIAYSQNAIGMVHLDMKDYRRALDFFISAMAIQKKYGQKLELANIYANIGKVMTGMERYSDADEYLRKALDVYTSTGNEYGQSTILNQIAWLLHLQNNDDQALQYLKQAEAIALKLQNNAVLHYCFKLQKDIYKGRNDFEKALYYSEQTSRMRDSLFSERRAYELTELQVRYETSRVDAENEILKLQLEQNSYKFRYILTGSIALILLTIMAFVFNRLRIKQQHSRKLEVINQELEQRVADRTKELHNEIIEKQHAYNSLKQNQEHLKGIYDTSPFGIAVTDQDGKIIHTNQRLSESTSIPAIEFTDSTWLRHIISEDRKTVESFWQNAHKYQGALSDLSFRLRDTKKIRWIRMKGAPMRDEGVFLGLVVVMENITESKNFEQDLIKAKNKAEESDLLKSAFLANMSHEIRTPMNAILGFSDLLATDDYSNDEKREFVEMIRSSGKLLLNLINDIIDISKIEAGELKIQHTSFKLSPVLDELFHTFRQQLDQNGKNQVKLIQHGREAALKFEITTDKLRLVQILTNLLSNASKFTEKGQIEFGVIHIGEHYQFFVKDTGIGIPESKLDVIFERFRQADDSHTRVFGGTGLGLAITKNLTQLLGGSIWVESVEGKGSAFYFTLPAPYDLGMTNKAYPDLSKKTILVAEDVDINFSLINGMLRNTHAKVFHAGNGMIAVDMAIELQPDLILMDIQMPEKDGIHALKEIKKHKPQSKIVAITAFALSDEGEKYIRMGFDSYLSKPLGMEKLIELVSLFLLN